MRFSIIELMQLIVILFFSRTWRLQWRISLRR